MSDEESDNSSYGDKDDSAGSDSIDDEDHLRSTRLLQLVQAMRDRVIFPSNAVQQIVWSEDVTEKAKAFFTKPELKELFLYVREGPEGHFTLEPRHMLRKDSCKALFYYFIKISDVEVTRDNFHDEVAFGKISYNGDPVDSMIEYMHSRWTAVLRGSALLPSFVEKTMSAETLHLLTYLRGWKHYEDKRATLLAPLDSETLKNSDPELIEGVVLVWLRQIRNALSLCESPAMRSKGSDSAGYLDEMKKWEALGMNLQSIIVQLKNPEIVQVLGLARDYHSPFMVQFDKLATKVEHEQERAASNLRYLEPLKPVIEKYLEPKTAPDLAAAINSYPQVVAHISTVWKTSPYYNSKESILGLINLLTNDVLKLCGSSVNLDKLFHGHSISSIEALENSILACEKWHELFTKGSSKKKSLLNQLGWSPTDIFAPLKTFVSRCHELIDVCNSVKQLVRMKTGRPNILIDFPGKIGPTLRQRLLDIERAFVVALKQLEKSKSKALIVPSASWQNGFTKFSEDVHMIEKQLKVLLKDSSDAYSRFDETVYVLDIFYEMSSRRALQAVFSECVQKVWRRFSACVEKIEDLFYALPEGMSMDYPFYSGQAWMANSFRNQLQDMKDQIWRYEWLPEKFLDDTVMTYYNVLRKEMEQSSAKWFQKWIVEVDKGGSLLSRLERPLLVPMVNTSQLTAPGISVNFDWELLDVFKEAIYWERLGFDLPRTCWEVYRKRDDIQWLREELSMFCQSYNDTVSQLTTAERLMFANHLIQVDRVVAPAMKSNNWMMNFGEAGQFLKHAHENLRNVKLMIDEYVETNLAVRTLVDSIGDLLLVDFARIDPDAVEPLLITNWLIHFEKSRGLRLKELTNFVKRIVIEVKQLSGAFDQFNALIATSWNAYVCRIDDEIETFIRKSLKNSLSAMKTFITRGVGPAVGAAAGEFAIVFEICFSEEKERVEVVPDPSLFAEAIGGTLQYIVRAISVIPRISASMNITVENSTVPFSEAMKSDQDLYILQGDIVTSLSLMEEEMDDAVRKWTEPFAHILSCHDWKKFVLEYLRASPSIQALIGDVSRYHDQWKVLDGTDPMVTVLPFLTLDFGPLKKFLLTVVDDLRVGLCDQLHGLAFERMAIAKAIDKQQSGGENIRGGIVDVTDYVLSVVNIVNLLQSHSYPIDENLVKETLAMAHRFLSVVSTND